MFSKFILLFSIYENVRSTSDDICSISTGNYKMAKCNSNGKRIEYECTQKNIDRASQIFNEDQLGYEGGTCGFIRDGWCQYEGNFNLLEMYYCEFDSMFGKNGKVIPICLFFVAMMYVGIYLITSTSDQYLSPCLEFLTLRFRIPESIAGVTLLAFGNGAADVFGSIAAAGDSNSNVTLNANKSVSLLVGGSFYIISVVMAMTTHAVKGPTPGVVQVTPRFFVRDVSFLLLTSLYLLVIMLMVGFINLNGIRNHKTSASALRFLIPC